jgi:hypothetical protein
VKSSFFAGAEMITFLAPRGRRVRPRLGGVGEEAGGLDDHVDALVGPLRMAGSRSANTLTTVSPTVIWPSLACTSTSRRPRMESNLSRWGEGLLSVRSLHRRSPMSGPEARTARKMFRADAAEADRYLR